MSHRQADQLAVAIGSPIATQEYQHRRGVEVIGKSPWFLGLIDQSEIGGHVATILSQIVGQARSNCLMPPGPLWLGGTGATQTRKLDGPQSRSWSATRKAAAVRKEANAFDVISSPRARADRASSKGNASGAPSGEMTPTTRV